VPFQNRVTPFGVFEVTSARGRLMGNRGCLVDAAGTLRRRWQVERWITCRLEFKGRTGHGMATPGRYTPLFFLDEATACAAGHRPCHECRRAEAVAFLEAWTATLPRGGGGARRFTDLDARLHRERTARAPLAAPVGELPDGAMIAWDGAAWLVLGSTLRPWSHQGYGAAVDAPAEAVTVLTPPTTVAAMRAGWRPLLHDSATGGGAGGC